MATLTYRPAQIGDAAGIHTLLLAIAGDIPLAVETLEQEEALYARCAKSWRSVNPGWRSTETRSPVSC